MINLENDYTCIIIDCDKSSDYFIDTDKTDKSTRVCRFCGKRQPEVTFKNIAHAISTGLNRCPVILNEECDTCNSSNSTLERNFIDWVHFYRVMYSISNRYGTIPSYQSSSSFPPVLSVHSLQYEIDHYTKFQGNYVIQTALTDEIRKFAPNLCCLRIKTNNYDELCNFYSETPTEIKISMPNKHIVYSDVYKGLLKYFISCVPSDQLQLLTKTKELFNMSNEDIKQKKLYLIIESQASLLTSPQLKIYTRQTSSDTLPYMVGEFLIAQTKLTLIIPSDNDTTDFTNITEQEYKNLFSYLPEEASISDLSKTTKDLVKQTITISKDPSTYTPIIELFENQTDKKNEMLFVMNMHSEPTRWDISLWIDEKRNA